MVYFDDVEEELVKKVMLLGTALLALTCLCCCSTKKSKTETKAASEVKQETVITEAKTKN